MMKRSILLTALTLMTLAVTCGPAGAVTVTFVEAPDGTTGTPLVTGGATGAGIVNVTVSNPTTESATVQFTVGGTVFDPLSNIFLLEPNGLTISDQISISVAPLACPTGLVATSCLRASITFTSDSPENNLGTLQPGQNAIVVIETGGPVTPFDNTNLPLGVTLGGVTFPLIITATSDLEQGVPEPATLLLLGSGLAGLGAVLRLKRRGAR